MLRPAPIDVASAEVPEPAPHQMYVGEKSGSSRMSGTANPSFSITCLETPGTTAITRRRFHGNVLRDGLIKVGEVEKPPSQGFHLGLDLNRVVGGLGHAHACLDKDKERDACPQGDARDYELDKGVSSRGAAERTKAQRRDDNARHKVVLELSPVGALAICKEPPRARPLAHKLFHSAT